MSWIELHQAVWTHRKTFQLAAELDLVETYAAAHVIRLWTWALDNAQEGDLSGMNPRVIAFGAGWDGDPTAFVAALIASGWIDVVAREDATSSTPTDMRLHDWADYAGRLIERRRQDAERKRQARSTPLPLKKDVRTPSAGRPGKNPDASGAVRRTGPNRTGPNRTGPDPTGPGLITPVSSSPVGVNNARPAVNSAAKNGERGDVATHPPTEEKTAVIESLVTEYASRFPGGADEVRRRIAKCQNQVDYDQVNDTRKALEIWLEEDLDWIAKYGASNDRNRNGNDPDANDPHRPGTLPGADHGSGTSAGGATRNLGGHAPLRDPRLRDPRELATMRDAGLLSAADLANIAACGIVLPEPAKP